MPSSMSNSPRSHRAYILPRQGGDGLQVEAVQQEGQRPRLLGDLGDGARRRLPPEQGHGDQVVHLPGRVAEAVDELVGTNGCNCC